MIDSSANTLIQLLRLALGNKAECGLPADIDWQSLIDLSFEQGVAAIAVDGLQRLYEANPGLELALDKPELEPLKYEWFGAIFQAENSFRDHLAAIASLTKLYSGSGISMMLLKGYGLSLNYPVPEHRPAGDIDVYLFGQWREADKLVKEKGIKIDYTHHHHSVFLWQGQMVENHYDIVNRYSSRNDRLTDDLLKKLAPTRRKLENGIYVPSATFNGIFLIGHAANHFAGNRIILRHLLDWALFVDKDWKEIDWLFVENWLYKVGLLDFLSCMNALSVDYLGLPKEKFPPLKRNAVLEKRVLEDILHPSFDESGSGLIFKLRRLKVNMWKRNLTSSEPWLLRMLRLGWSHLLRPEKMIGK